MKAILAILLRIFLTICMIITVVWVPILFGFIGGGLYKFFFHHNIPFEFSQIGGLWFLGVGTMCSFLIIIIFIYWIFTGRFIFK